MDNDQATPPAAVPSEPTAPTPPAPEPAQQPIQLGMSASQLGYGQRPENSRNINFKQLAIKGAILLVVLAAATGVLMAMNVISLKEFKNISYTNTAGTMFSLDFYSKHGIQSQNTGNPQLVAKNGKYEKLPLTFSIATANGEESYNKYKNCGGFTKVFEVQNSTLNQTIAVCDATSKTTKAPSNGVYIAVFLNEGKSNIVTIGQDYSKADISSKSSAQDSLTKFGLQPYQADITHMLSSITVQ